MAFSAVIALAAGETASTVLVLSAIAEVGTALTVVGAVTGSKDLMKIGAVMGVVGGIGGAIAGGAVSAGADAAVSQAGADAAASALPESVYGSAAQELGDQTAIAGMQGVEQGATTGIVGSDVVAPSAQTATQTATAPVAQSSVTATPIHPTQPASAATTDVASGANAPNGATAPVGAQGPADVANPYSNPTDMRLANNLQRTPGDPVSASGPSLSSDSLFSRFSTWASQNKEIMASGTQLVGGVLKGMNDSSMWDQKMQLARDQFTRANSVGTFAPRTTGIVGSGA